MRGPSSSASRPQASSTRRRAVRTSRRSRCASQSTRSCSCSSSYVSGWMPSAARADRASTSGRVSAVRPSFSISFARTTEGVSPGSISQARRSSGPTRSAMPRWCRPRPRRTDLISSIIGSLGGRIPVTRTEPVQWLARSPVFRAVSGPASAAGSACRGAVGCGRAPRIGGFASARTATIGEGNGNDLNARPRASGPIRSRTANDVPPRRRAADQGPAIAAQPAPGGAGRARRLAATSSARSSGAPSDWTRGGCGTSPGR